MGPCRSGQVLLQSIGGPPHLLYHWLAIFQASKEEYKVQMKSMLVRADFYVHPHSDWLDQLLPEYTSFNWILAYC